MTPDPPDPARDPWANTRTRQAHDSGGAQLRPGVARDLSALARDLEAESDSDAVVQYIVAAAVSLIDGATGAAITVLEHGELSSRAHSDETARLAAAAEAVTSQGPCADTLREAITLRSDDLRTDARWPQWAAVAVELGVLSAMSFQLFVQADSMGSLNVFGDQPDAFDADAENTGLLLAAHAAVALADTSKIENLQVALNTRELVGQAKGILMERHKVNPAQALDMLVLSSHHSHRKLVDVADQLIRTGQMPSGTDRS